MLRHQETLPQSLVPPHDTTEPRLNTRHASYSRPPPSLLSQPPFITSCSHKRPRVFSTPSFGERVSTTELEKGKRGSFASTTSSRCSSVDSVDTRVPSALWNSVFSAINTEGLSPSVAPASVMNRSSSRLSCVSVTSVVPYDEDDPRMTGKMREKGNVAHPTQAEGEMFMVLLAQALMKFGAPSHRVEGQLASVAASVRVKVQALHFPGVTVLSFGNHDNTLSGSETRFIKAATKIDLGRLHTIHKLYKDVVHFSREVKVVSRDLKDLLKKDPIFGVPEQICLAIICGLILSPMAYKGSVLDLLAAGLCCGAITWLQLCAAKKNQLLANMIEIISAILMSFVGRGLSSLKEGIFCYSAITSTGVVKLLPKYLIICGSLELASKQINTGSVKMVYAVIWSLFLGFAITLGSDFYYLIDSGARHRRLAATQYMADALNLEGFFSIDNTPINGDFFFTNVTAPASSRLYSANGCFRDPDWPWYLQAPPMWTLFFLVPLYAIFSAFAAFQPLRSRELPVMVLVSCCSYAANRAVHLLLPSRADISGAIGAFVIGTMGHLYSRIFHGTAFIIMFNGIGFLVPSALAATGGLAQNYRGKQANHYESSLELAFRMIQVAIGTTVGLFASSLVVYSFGRRKNGALWAF